MPHPNSWVDPFGLSKCPTDPRTISPWNLFQHETKGQFAAVALQQSEQLFAQPARLIANRHVRSQDQLNTTIREWKANQVSGMVTFQGNGENPGFGVGQRIVV